MPSSLVGLPLVALAMWALGALLVNRGIVTTEGALALCSLIGLVVAVRMLMLKLVIDDAGVEVVNLLHRHLLNWSEIARIRVAEDAEGVYDDSSLQFVLRSPGRRRRRWVRARAGAVGGAELMSMVDALNGYAALHGIPSSITAEKLAGQDPVTAVPVARPHPLLGRASPRTRHRLLVYANRVVSSHPRAPRPLDRLLLARLAVRGARAGSSTAPLLLVVVIAWVTYVGLAPEVRVIDPGGVLLVGLAGAVWLVGLLVLPLAAYRRLRRVLERGALATAVVTEVGPSSADSAGRVDVVRRVEDTRGTFDDRSTVRASADAPRTGVRTRVLLDPSASRVVLELGPA